MRPHANRRHFLKLSLAAAGAALACPAVALARTDARALAFHNLHTGESIRTVYWADGRYVRESLREIDRLLRDHRTGDVTRMDPRLMDLLHTLRSKLDSRAPFQVISGYRSPKTNALLREQGGGVAKRSLHMRGKAIDIFLPDRDLRLLRKAALALNAGGVGYYPDPGFLHVDTGRVRAW